ncbi:MAG: beta-glucosidase [Chloroflexi bacterium RBG_19FT_COMBO_47_9]|nr:MAG: beta-glucosidase [Chloroflexi bacterium RBG_16_47_49]OGO60963.1 MAG: beta-glucosidase [Chloroflexi bacterium RBG_19FT_COMBO_47_9]
MNESTQLFINNLLSQMTLEEKIGQLNQPNVGERLDPAIIRQGKVGSLIIAAGALTGQGSSESVGAEHANQLQRMALESRLKIPLIFGRDVIHGCRTIFPIPLAQAATFNPELAQKAASVAAQEASAGGIKWTFAPMLDIARDPRWGRVAEGNGEDPHLSSQMAASLVIGYQGENMAMPNKLVACAKHYIGYGSAEGGRDYENGEISEPTLRDVYMPPYESAVGAGVGTVMSAFLDLNGIPATANRRLLTDVLRGEWGFDGFVVSDWASVAELIQHGVAEDSAKAASIALHAGVDMDMASEAYINTLAANIHTGTTSIQEIDEAARRILSIKQRAGLFDHPYTDPTRFGREVLTSESRQLARQFARECMVLLKNKGNILPLRDFRKILIAGDYVNAQGELYGTWSPDGHGEDCVSLKQAVKDTAPKEVELSFADNYDQALRYALQTDLIVLVLGEHPRRSGENSNLSDLSLPPGQAEFIDLMATIGKPVVLVIFAGRPLVLTHQMSQVDVILYAWHPGIEGGAALGDILFGMQSPIGRLPITFPRATGQIPIYYNHKNSGRPITDTGWYSSRYVDLPATPLLPFGFGLSYTNFEYSNLELSHSNLRDKLLVSADITNTGKQTGIELVQLYVRDLVGSLTRPVRELKAFQRIQLQPGETQHVSFTVTEEMLSYTRANGTKGVEPGLFHVWIAPNSASGLRGEFRL